MIIHKDSIVCFIGTYTKNKSEGIYRFDFDKQSKTIGKSILAYEVENPTYLAIDYERHILYSTCKIGDKAGVSSFKYWKEQDKLNFVNYNTSEINQPCHISIEKDTQLLVSSNYHENKMIVYNTLEGFILNSKFISSHSGHSINPDRQDAPHIHFSSFTPDKKYILSVDLGIDKIVVYEFKNNEITQRNDLSYSFPEGTGPRHIAFLNNSYTYVLSELTSEIFVLKYVDNENNLFENIQTISALSPDYNKSKSGAAIRIHPNNKFLYTSDRGNNSISLFSILTDGTLKYVNTFSTHGDSPRDFNIDPSGEFLFCANEKSDNVSIFAINKQSGELSFVDSPKVYSPTSIVFA